MKVVKWLLFFGVGTLFGLIGFAVLGVPPDLPTYRRLLGIVCLAAAIIVWVRWA